MLTDQWYRAAPIMAKTAIEAVEDDIQFVPKQYENMYFSGCDIQDWCVSPRQLWWGHRIPAWYDNAGNVYVGRSEDEVRRENNLSADVACVRTKTFSIPGSAPRWDLLHPRLAEQHRGLVSSTRPA